MLQVRKSLSHGIFAIFLHCFMIETQVLMAVSDALGFFTRNHFLEGDFTFQGGGFIFKWGGGWGLEGGWVPHGGSASVLMRGGEGKGGRKKS